MIFAIKWHSQLPQWMGPKATLSEILDHRKNYKEPISQPFWWTDRLFALEIWLSDWWEEPWLFSISPFIYLWQTVHLGPVHLQVLHFLITNSKFCDVVDSIKLWVKNISKIILKKYTYKLAVVATFRLSLSTRIVIFNKTYLVTWWAKWILGSLTRIKNIELKTTLHKWILARLSK